MNEQKQNSNNNREKNLNDWENNIPEDRERSFQMKSRSWPKLVVAIVVVKP